MKNVLKYLFLSTPLTVIFLTVCVLSFFIQPLADAIYPLMILAVVEDLILRSEKRIKKAFRRPYDTENMD